MVSLIEGNPDVFIEIIKGVTGILFSIISILFAYQFFKFRIKRKNKWIQFKSEKTEMLKFTLLLVMYHVLQIAIIQYVGYELLGEKISLYMSIILTIIMFISSFVSYIKISIRCDKAKGIMFTNINFLNKTIYIFRNWLVPIIIYGICILIYSLICMLFSDIIKSIIDGQNFYIGKSIIECILLYTLNIIVILYVYGLEKIGLRKLVKEVRVFYLQNNRQKIELDIEYERFDINKEFINFYSVRKGCNIVVPTKDLIKIEYYYY